MLNFSTGFSPLHMRDAPADVIHNRFRTSEGHRERIFPAMEIIRQGSHSPELSASKCINGLPGVTDSDKSVGRELSKHCMVDFTEVLRLVNQDEGKAWKCSSEQSGHEYLIIKIDGPLVRLENALVHSFVH